MRRLVLRGALVAGVAILAVAASARATFPGVNGNIAYSYCEDGHDCQAWHVWITPRHGAAFPYVPPQRLFADPPGVFEDDPAFSADGRQVAASRCTNALPYDTVNRGVRWHGSRSAMWHGQLSCASGEDRDRGAAARRDLLLCQRGPGAAVPICTPRVWPTAGGR